MPLGGKLSDSEIATIRQWIASGAQWDGNRLELTKATPKSGFEKQFTEADRSWWAFQKPVLRPAPAVSNPAWRANPIDGFVYAALEKRNLAAAPPADRRTLIRRAYLDLIGLLPTPEDVEAICE